MKLVIGKENWQRAASIYVRMEVFVLERQIALEDEFDDNDHQETVYAVVYDGDRPVSTGRFMVEDDQTVRLTRIATLQEYRGRQLGSQIIRGLEDYAREQGYTHSLIHAEQSAIPFYQKLGYTLCSDVYYEDGVPCQNLERSLTP